jgi:hypothetical protein
MTKPGINEPGRPGHPQLAVARERLHKAQTGTRPEMAEGVGSKASPLP